MHSSTLVAVALAAAVAPSLAAPFTSAPTVNTQVTDPSLLDESGAITFSQVTKGINVATDVVTALNTGLDFVTQHFG